MINIFKSKKNSKSQIVVECDKDGININGIEVSFPTHLNTLKDIFGEPSRKEHDLLWRVVWDELGIYTDYGTWDNILDVKFLLSNNHKLEYFPKKLFKGQIRVENRDVTTEKFEKYDLKKHRVRKLTYKEEINPYAISVGKNLDYEEEIPKDKYTIRYPDEEIIEFKDFNFKIAIINELMYNKELIQPKFDLLEFVKWYSERDIDLEEEGYDLIPEVVDYFRKLPITKNLAKKVTEINQDGLYGIYENLLRFMEGYDDYDTIKSSEDIIHFPNLKKAYFAYAEENVINELKDKGIESGYWEY